MGRWHQLPFDSKYSLQFISFAITDKLEREIAYWLSPENIYQQTSWLTKVLTVIELMLLFDSFDSSTGVFLWEKDEKVAQWETTIMAVWMADWDASEKQSGFPYGALAYRRHHTSVIKEHLGYLKQIAENNADETRANFQKRIETTEFPDFSIFPTQTRHGNTIHLIDRFVGDLIRELTREIVFLLSDENRFDVLNMAADIEEIWVAVDVLALLCETYKTTPNITHDTVSKWHKKAADIWRIHVDEGELHGEDPEVERTVSIIFDKLRDIARQSPPWWGDVDLPDSQI